MDSKMTGALISECRKEKGLTQRDIAEKLCISNRTVSKWENGDGFPDVTLLPQIAELLGITIDELLAGERKPQEIQEQSKVLFSTDGSESKATLAQYRMLYKIDMNSHIPAWTRSLVIICLIVVCIAANAVLMNETIFYIGIALLAFFFFCELCPSISAALAKANNEATDMNENGSSFTVYGSGEMVLKTSRRTVSYYVNEVTAIYKRNNTYYLKIGRRIYLFVGCNDFTTGSGDEFYQYVKQNMTPSKKPTLKRVYSVVSAILMTSLTITAVLLLTIAGVSSKNNHSYEDYLKMSTEELAQLNEEQFMTAVDDRVFEKVYNDEKLNKLEREYYILADFKNSVVQDDDEEAGLCYYLYYARLEDYNELFSALENANMANFSDGVKKFIKDNDIDIMDFNSKMDYDELYKKYPFKAFDEKSKGDYAMLSKAIENYMRDNVDKL